MALRGVTEAEARRATELVVKVKVEESGFALAAPSSLHVFLASAESSFRVTRSRVVVRSVSVAVTRLASMRSEVIMIGLATITLLTANSGLALTLSFRVTLQRSRSSRVAVTMRAISVFTHVKVLFAAFAIGSISVGLTIHAVTSVTGQIVEVSVEVAFVRVAVAITWLALMSVFGCGTSPRGVIVEWQTLFAIGTIGVVLALANLSSFSVESGAINALVGVTVALAASTNCNIGDGIEVRTEYLLVAEQLVTECVEAIQDDSDVSGSDPLLELNAVLEIVGAGAALERREGDVSELEW